MPTSDTEHPYVWINSYRADCSIADDVERTVWILWSSTVLLTSIIGDSIILIGTIKYKAIKQHEVTVAVMQHMAVCDLLQTIFRVLPVILALVADRWVMGGF